MVRKKKSVVRPGKQSISLDVWEKEVHRQSFHLAFGFFLSGILFFTNLDFFRLVSFALLGVGIVLVLLARAKMFPVLNALLQKVHREHEKIPGQSAFIFLIGALIPALIIPNSFAVFLGVFSMTLQDGFSTLFGVRFGRTKIFPRKTVEGSLGGFAACAAGLLLFLPFSLAVPLALFATLIELLPVDDSLSVPVAVAFVARLFV